MTTDCLLICVGTTGMISALGYAVLRRFDRYGQQLEARCQETFRREIVKTPRARRRQKPDQPEGAGSWASALNCLVPSRDVDRQRHQSRMIQAGIYRRAALTTFFTVKLLLMMTPPLLAVAAASMQLGKPRAVLALGCSAGVVGMLLPTAWLDRKIRRRQAILADALPDWLDLMTVCLQGGLSVPGALQRVGDELQQAHPLLAGELSIVQREVELGMSVAAAFKRFGERTGCDQVQRLTNVIRDSQRLGSELCEALRLQADALRSQRETEAEERAQKASVQILIPTLLFIFPAVFVPLAGPAAIRIHESFSQPAMPLTSNQ